MLMAFVGEAGNAILFMSLMLMFIITGTFLLAYAAYSFFVVVQDTAAGLDEVTWPGESPAEWLGRAAILIWLVLVWLAPLGMVLRVTAPGIAREQPERVVLLVGLILWFFMPIGVLSSLSSMSSWAFFRPKLLAGLARIAPTALGFYALTPPLLGAVLTLWFIALVGEPLLMPVAAVVGSAALLIYARLLGRVAWKLNSLEPSKRSRSRKKEERPPQAVSTHDPWVAPPTPRRKKKRESPPVVTTNTGDAEGEGPEAYGVAPEEPATYPDWMTSKKRKKSSEAITTESDAYPLADEEPAPRPVQVPLDGYAPVDEPLPPVPVQAPEESPLEKRLAERTPQVKPPAFSLLSGVWDFPLYSRSHAAWFRLSLLGTFAGYLLRLMLQTWPG